MIQDVDESLRALVKREALNGSKAEIAFDAPTREWASRRNSPTVDLYLYDIREDLERREVMWEEIRGPDGFVKERRPPPRRFKLSYLVTAWTQRPEDEHRLLSSVLSCFIRYQAMPDDVLAGTLADSSESVLMNIAMPPPQDRSISDVWSALGGELKPSLDLVVNAPFEINKAAPAGPPVLEEPRITVGRPGLPSEEVASADGKRRRAAARKSAAQRAVQGEADDASLGEQAASADAAGQATGPLQAGWAVQEAAQAGESQPAKPLEPGEQLTPAAEAAQHEAITPGRESKRGRIVRLRGIPRS